MQADPDYVRQLETLPEKLRQAWLEGRWDVFEGQFFPEFRPDLHVVSRSELPSQLTYFVAFDYGFDMLAALLMGVDMQGNLFVLAERCLPDLTLREAALEVATLCKGFDVPYAVASPDLWNRRQDTGRSGFEVMQAVIGMPPMTAADNRRIPGWRILREYLNPNTDTPSLRICNTCPVLIHSLPALLCSSRIPEDASDHPHAVTHAPEALRYAVMSRIEAHADRKIPDRNFRFPKRRSSIFD
jgi:phage terminase large subunit